MLMKVACLRQVELYPGQPLFVERSSLHNGTGQVFEMSEKSEAKQSLGDSSRLHLLSLSLGALPDCGIGQESIGRGSDGTALLGENGVDD